MAGEVLRARAAARRRRRDLAKTMRTDEHHAETMLARLSALGRARVEVRDDAELAYRGAVGGRRRRARRPTGPACERDEAAAVAHARRRRGRDVGQPRGGDCAGGGAGGDAGAARAHSPSAVTGPTPGPPPRERGGRSVKESEDDPDRVHVHGFHTYPARMHPQTAARLVRALSGEGATVLDPFCRLRHGPRRGDDRRTARRRHGPQPARRPPGRPQDDAARWPLAGRAGRGGAQRGARSPTSGASAGRAPRAATRPRTWPRSIRTCSSSSTRSVRASPGRPMRVCATRSSSSSARSS